MATLQSGKCFTVPTFFGMCCRSEWQERMYIYKWHEVDQTKHEIFCVHIVCNEIQVKVNLEINTFFFFICVFFFCYQQFLFLFFSHTTQQNIQNKTKQNSRHILNISRFNQKGGRGKDNKNTKVTPLNNYVYSTKNTAKPQWLKAWPHRLVPLYIHMTQFAGGYGSNMPLYTCVV